MSEFTPGDRVALQYSEADSENSVALHGVISDPDHAPVPFKFKEDDFLVIEPAKTRTLPPTLFLITEDDELYYSEPGDLSYPPHYGQVEVLEHWEEEEAEETQDNE